MIDFDFLPHIRDAIVQHACPESLLNLRSVSRKLRDMSDERLFDHVEVEITFEGVVLVHPFGSPLGFEWMRLDVNIAGDPHQGVPSVLVKAYSDPESCTPERERLRHYIQTRMERARVIDVKREPKQPPLRRRVYYTPPLLDILSQLEGTVRFFHPDDVNHTVKPKDLSYLLFWRPQRIPSRVQDLGDIQALGEKLMRSCFRGPWKITVHLLNRAHVGQPGRKRMWVQTSAPERKNKTEKATSPPNAQSSSEIKRCQPSQIEEVCTTFYPPFELTVVGGIEQLRVAFGLSPAPAARLCEELDAVAATLRRPDMVSGLTLPPPHFRFLTPEAYLEEVGADKFALQTQLDPYKDPAAQYVP